MPDGNAYAFSKLGGIWYLRGGEAVRVKEVSAFSNSKVSSAPNREKVTWSFWQGELSKRRRLEKEINDLESQVEELKDKSETSIDDNNF